MTAHVMEKTRLFSVRLDFGVNIQYPFRILLDYTRLDFPRLDFFVVPKVSSYEVRKFVREEFRAFFSAHDMEGFMEKSY